MGFLDELIASAKTVVDKAEKQTDKVVELSKLKYQSAQLSSELKSLYEKLGCAVYAMMNNEYENKELVDSLADEITEVRAALAVVNEKIDEQMNRRFCPACGAQNVKEAVFCMKCGTRMDPEAAEEEPVAECCCEAEKETPAEGCCCDTGTANNCCCGEGSAEECCDADEEKTE